MGVKPCFVLQLWLLLPGQRDRIGGDRLYRFSFGTWLCRVRPVLSGSCFDLGLCCCLAPRHTSNPVWCQRKPRESLYIQLIQLPCWIRNLEAGLWTSNHGEQAILVVFSWTLLEDLSFRISFWTFWRKRCWKSCTRPRWNSKQPTSKANKTQRPPGTHRSLWGFKRGSFFSEFQSYPNLEIGRGGSKLIHVDTQPSGWCGSVQVLCNWTRIAKYVSTVVRSYVLSVSEYSKTIWVGIPVFPPPLVKIRAK